MCWSKEIEHGEITCPECQRVFPIREGIPRLLPDQLRERETVPDKQNWRIKWQQMRQRDQEAEIFEANFLPYQNRLDAETCLEAIDLNEQHRLLDSGAGVGRLLEFAYERYGEIVAADFSVRSLMVLQKRIQDRKLAIHLVVADVEHLPFRESIFDKTVSFGILEHLPNLESRRATLQEMRRTMRPGGSAAVTAYNFTPLRRFLAPIFGADYQKEGWHDEIFFHRSDAAEYDRLIRDVFASADPSRGLRNIPKTIASILAPVLRPLDRLIGRLRISRITGYYLLAKLTVDEDEPSDR